MKSSELKQLIKEEILKVISENNPLLNEISADEGSARYENAYEKLIGRPGSEEEGRFLAEFTPQERIKQILKSAYIENKPKVIDTKYRSNLP